MCMFLCIYIALGELMLYVDGMNAMINDRSTVQWLHSLIASDVSNDFSESVTVTSDWRHSH